jgi:hypothetical protein
MTDIELDELLNCWQTPAPSASLRARVLAGVRRRERRAMGRTLRWSIGLAAATCVLAVGLQSAGGGTLDSVAGGVNRLVTGVGNWLEDLAMAHVMHAFRNSGLKVYVDGAEESGASTGGGQGTIWVRMPGEGRYLMLMKLTDGAKPVSVGKFDGHAVEFTAGGRAIRIESPGRYGFGGERPVYVFGPVQR